MDIVEGCYRFIQNVEPNLLDSVLATLMVQRSLGRGSHTAPLLEFIQIAFLSPLNPNGFSRCTEMNNVKNLAASAKLNPAGKELGLQVIGNSCVSIYVMVEKINEQIRWGVRRLFV